MSCFFSSTMLGRVVALTAALAAITTTARAEITYLDKWGTSGSGDGQFYYPTDAAVDSAGNVYVTDEGNNRIEKFTATGTFLSAWGTAGAGNGQFSGPTGIAISSAGEVYVADRFNNRIQVFDTSGNYVRQWSNSYNGPTGVDVDSVGNVYVVDKGNGLIQKCTSTGSLATTFGSAGSVAGLNGPWGVAVDASNHVYVTERGYERVDEFDSTGALVNQWNHGGNFVSLFGIDVSKTGQVYVVDRGNGDDPLTNNIRKFSSDGTWLATFGDSGDGKLVGPYGVAVAPTGMVYAVDDAGQSIVRYFDSSVTVPEPCTLVLVSSGIVGLLCYAWRKRK